MIKKFILLICIVLPCMCSAKVLTTKDIESFDVAGVKIGMSEGEALKALSNKYNVPESKIKVSHDLSNNRVIALELVIDEGNIEVGLVDDISVTPSKQAVYKVNYVIPNTPNNIKALYESAIQKYGQPSEDGQGFFSWCQLKDPKAKYRGCVDSTARLTVYKSLISISTEKYAIAKKQLENAKLDRKPKF